MSNLDRSADYDYKFNVVLIGDSGVGKTAILTRYTEDNFRDCLIKTIGIDFRVKTVRVKEKIVKLQVWDTAGQERFNSITPIYCRKADGIIFVYDVTSQNSFENIVRWVERLKEQTQENVSYVIIGNKVDLKEERSVTTEKGKELSRDIGVQFLEVSAKDGCCVNDAFYILMKAIIKKIASNTLIGVRERVHSRARVVDVADHSGREEKSSSKCCRQ